MKCYPVLIPTLNRYEHLRNCITSLSECRHSDETDLIIGLDYPPSKNYEEGYKKIKEYLKTITGFRSVKVFERAINYGAVKNIRELIDYARENYEAYIVSEDDNVFSPVFLEFMNSALERWKDDDRVSTVCGYAMKTQYNETLDYILTSDYSAWGTGCWVDKTKIIEHSFVRDVLFSVKKSYYLFRRYPLCLEMLRNMYEKRQWYGDTVRTTYNIFNKRYQVRPSVSLVRNMGHDGSGLNCGSNDYGFSSQELSERSGYRIDEESKGKILSWHHLFFQGFHCSKIRALLSIAKIWIRYLKFRIKSKKIQSLEKFY